jgi:hypothetical protein
LQGVPLSIKHIVSVFKARIITDRDRNEFKNLCDKWTIVVEHPSGSGCKCLAIKPWLIQSSSLGRHEEGLEEGAGGGELADAPGRSLAGSDRSPGKGNVGEGLGDHGSREGYSGKKLGGLGASPLAGGESAVRRLHQRQVVTTGTSPTRSS